MSGTTLQTITRHIDIKQGDTFDWSFVWSDADKKPRNLTGFTAHMQIRHKATDVGDPYVDLTTENGGIVLGGVTGTVAITIDAATTAAFDWTAGTYDLKVIGPGGVPTKTLIEGRVQVYKSVTRDTPPDVN